MYKRQHFRSLDTLRGIAALAICLYHAHSIFGLDVLIPHAYLEVDLFFILSGFILVQRYAPEIASNSKKISLSDFAIIRLARLYPLYLLASIIGALYFAAWLFVNGQLFANFKNYILAIINSIIAIPYLAKPFDEVGAIFPFATQAWSIFWEIIAVSYTHLDVYKRQIGASSMGALYNLYIKQLEPAYGFSHASAISFSNCFKIASAIMTIALLFNYIKNRKK